MYPRKRVHRRLGPHGSFAWSSFTDNVKDYHGLHLQWVHIDMLYHRGLHRADVRRNDAYSRVRSHTHTHTHTEALFYLSFELAGIVIEYAVNAAAEYAISQMIRENSSWPVRFYAGANFFLFLYAQRSNGQHHRGKNGGWIGMRWYHTSRECRAIDIKTFPNHCKIREWCAESCCVIIPSQGR